MSSLNLFEAEPLTGQEESFETLLQCRNVTIERIHSPAGTHTQEFNQQQDEWICLLQGVAQLQLAAETIRLEAGQSLFIPARVPHRVLHTSVDPLCIWLAVHIH